MSRNIGTTVATTFCGCFVVAAIAKVNSHPSHRRDAIVFALEH